jgi:hypothetical protein
MMANCSNCAHDPRPRREAGRRDKRISLSSASVTEKQSKVKVVRSHRIRGVECRGANDACCARSNNRRLFGL